MDNLERNNEVIHKLYSSLMGEITIQEPKGWSNDTKSFQRDENSRGIYSKTTVELEFYGDGAEWLSTLYYSFGIEARVILSKYEKDNSKISEEWTLKYVQELDMATFDNTSRTGAVKVQATEGGLYDDIKNRMSDKYNIINNLSADGIDIGELNAYPFEPKPRSIFLESLFDDKQNGYRINSATRAYPTSKSETQRTIPLKEVYNSDKTNLQAPFNSFQGYNDYDEHDQNYEDGTVQSIGDQIVWQIDRDKTLNINLNLKFRIAKVDHNDVWNRSMGVEYRISTKDEKDDDLLTYRELLWSITNPDDHVGTTYTINQNWSDQFLAEGQSLSIVFYTKLTGDDGADKGHMDVYLDVSESRVLIQDETPYPATLSKCLKPFDLFERLIAKITGKNNLFKSDIFGVGGKYEYMVVDNGFWARGFPDSIFDDDGKPQEIQFNTSFKDAFESFNYLEPLTWFIDVVESKEVVRIEEATYTMKNFIGLSLPAVDKIENKASKKDYFSRVKIGHKQSLEYEEVNGLDEFNGLSEFTTHITRNGDNEYSVQSEYRFDSEGYELIRRIQYADKPKEDTERDEDIWIHDAKLVGSKITHNLWGDRFDSPPTGIYDFATAWNLWLSPMNRLYYGHGYSLARGLYHFPTKKVRFNSSNANQNLTTTKGGLTLYEGGSNSEILVKDLGKPRVEATRVELSFKITQAIEKQLNATTSVNGEEIPNYFGLIEYTEKGEKRYGRLIKLEADEESKLTIQKARL